MALMIAMVLVDGARPCSATAFAECFRARWPESPAPTELEGEDLTFSCGVGFDDVIVGRMPAPIPWADLEGPCATSVLWKDAAVQVRAHTEHYVVTVNGELGPIALSGLLTRAVAALLDATEGAMGVYWHSAQLLVPRELFVEFASKVLPYGPPLAIWVDFRVYRTDDGHAAGFTSGLAALGFHEFEVERAYETPSALYDRLQMLAEYVMANPAAIQDGHTVGKDATEKIRVRFTPSRFERPGQVMTLEWAPPLNTRLP
jgi:hypothetical protein